MRVFLFSMALLLLPVLASAGEIIDSPQCFNVINRAPYTVTGSVSTDYYTTPDGIKARHRGNFRLKSGEQTEFCSTGPFYEGRKLDLVLRTLIPIFSCKTGIGGDIVIEGRRKEEGGTETRATCLE